MREFIELIPIPLIRVENGEILSENKAAEDFYIKMNCVNFKTLVITAQSPDSTKLTADIQNQAQQFKASSAPIYQIEADYKYGEVELVVRMYFKQSERGIFLIIQEKDKENLIKEEKIANRYKSVMIKSLSHDLKTPLNGMVATLDLFKQGKEITKEEMGALHLSVNLLKIKINDMLDFSLIETNEFFPLAMKTKLLRLFIQITNLLEFQANIEKKVLKYKFEGVNSTLEVSMNEEKLTQILIHLILNAIKFSSHYSKITLFVSTKKPSLNDIIDMPGGIEEEYKEEMNNHVYYLGVRDNGYGISKSTQKLLQKLIDSQFSLLTFSESGDLGLGLTITSKIIRALGSRLKFLSQANIGSIFYFKLVENYSLMEENISSPYLCRIGSFGPRQKERRIGRGTSAEIIPKQRAGGIEIVPGTRNLMNRNQIYISNRRATKGLKMQTVWLRGKKVLVVEDNGINALVLINLLKRIGVETESASDGQEALNILRRYMRREKKHPFVFIFMDLNMPILNGFDATIQINKLIKEQQMSPVDVIALTAFDTDSLRQKCLKIGFKQFMKKPITFDQIKDTIDHYSKSESGE